MILEPGSFFVRNARAWGRLEARTRFFASNTSRQALLRPVRLSLPKPVQSVVPGFGGRGASKLSVRAPGGSSVWSRVPRVQSRGMATHRDLGNWGSKGSGWGGGNRILNILRNHRQPILFTIGTVAVTAIALPLIMRIPGFSWLQRNPDYVVYGLMAANIAGFALWKTRRGSRLMYHYGLLHKDSQFHLWSMLGSAFSHQEVLHLGVNMFVLYNFGIPVCRWMGSDQFLAAYIDGAVISSLGSLLLPVLIKQFVNVPSLGASGAVFTIFGIFTYVAPHAKLALLGLPLPVGAWTVFMGTLAYNMVGMVKRFGRSDYAGHVAGSLVGIVWGWILSQRIYQQSRRRSSFGR